MKASTYIYKSKYVLFKGPVLRTVTPPLAPLFRSTVANTELRCRSFCFFGEGDDVFIKTHSLKQFVRLATLETTKFSTKMTHWT